MEISHLNSEKSEKIIVLFVFLVVLAKRLVMLNMGLNPEESKDFVSILAILDGQVPYRDFLWIYGFLGLYVNALFIKFLGVVDIWVPRFVVSVVFS